MGWSVSMLKLSREGRKGARERRERCIFTGWFDKRQSSLPGLEGTYMSLSAVTECWHCCICNCYN